jgi:hypothetical protein
MILRVTGASGEPDRVLYIHHLRGPRPGAAPATGGSCLITYN